MDRKPKDRKPKDREHEGREHEDQGAASFDQRLERLEKIVHTMESGELGLETAIGQYKEGIALLKECSGVLAGYKKQVEELSAQAEGELTPYAEDPDHPGRADQPDQ